ncbi:MAG: flagellar hook-associated protein FlgL, partial [Succinivibrio sp.]
KFQTAGEDPSGMASKVKYEGAIASYNQFTKDGGLANNTLSEEETTLESIWSALSSINTRLIQCVDGSNDQNSLNALASEIEQTRDQLFNLMNTQNTEGEYIFSGARSDIPTFSLTSDGHYSCQADGSTRSVLVSPSVTVQVSDSGLDIFENCLLEPTIKVTGNPTIVTTDITNYGDFEDLYEQYYSSSIGNTVYNHLRIEVTNGKFALYKDTTDAAGTVIPSTTPITEGEIDTDTNTITVKGIQIYLGDNYDETTNGSIDIELEKPKTDNILNVLTDIVDTIRDESMSKTDKCAAIAQCQKNVIRAMNRYDSYRGEIGARQNTIETILSSNQALADINTESKANVSEMDAFEAVSNLVQSQNQLSVSRQIYSSLSKQSLFDYI